MKHNQNNRRQRSRGSNGRRYPNQRGGSFESSGPEVKVRGTAQQVLEKYQSLARDAFSSGDRILAEGYLQHAEHYYRILNADNEQNGQNPNRNRARGNRDEDFDDDGDDDGQDDVVAQRPSNGGEQSSGATEIVIEQAASEPPVEVASEDDGQAAEEATAEEAPRPRRSRSRRPRKPEQPELAGMEQPAVGD